jgi:hypothetical protein
MVPKCPVKIEVKGQDTADLSGGETIVFIEEDIDLDVVAAEVMQKYSNGIDHMGCRVVLKFQGDKDTASSKCKYLCSVLDRHGFIIHHEKGSRSGAISKRVSISVI